MNSVGNTIDEKACRANVINLHDRGLLTDDQAKLIIAATAECNYRDLPGGCIQGNNFQTTFTYNNELKERLLCCVKTVVKRSYNSYKKNCKRWNSEAHLALTAQKAWAMMMQPDMGFSFSICSARSSMKLAAALSSHMLRCEKCGSTFNDIVKAEKSGVPIAIQHFMTSCFRRLKEFTAERITRAKSQTQPEVERKSVKKKNLHKSFSRQNRIMKPQQSLETGLKKSKARKK